MNTIETILSIITALSGGGLLGIFLERKKRNAEANAVEADVFAKMEEQYKKYIEHSNQKFEELANENEKLRNRVKELENQLEELKCK